MIANSLINFHDEDSYKILIMNYTKKKLENYYTNLKFLIPNINKNIKKVCITNSILEKIEKLIKIYNTLIKNLEDNFDPQKIKVKLLFSEEQISRIKKKISILKILNS